MEKEKAEALREEFPELQLLEEKLEEKIEDADYIGVRRTNEDFMVRPGTVMFDPGEGRAVYAVYIASGGEQRLLRIGDAYSPFEVLRDLESYGIQAIRFLEVRKGIAWNNAEPDGWEVFVRKPPKEGFQKYLKNVPPEFREEEEER